MSFGSAAGVTLSDAVDVSGREATSGTFVLGAGVMFEGRDTLFFSCVCVRACVDAVIR